MSWGGSVFVAASLASPVPDPVAGAVRTCRSRSNECPFRLPDPKVWGSRDGFRGALPVSKLRLFPVVDAWAGPLPATEVSQNSLPVHRPAPRRGIQRATITDGSNGHG